MPGFDATPLVVPPLWDHDWVGLIDDHDGIEKELVRTQRFAVQSLSRMVSVPASPESVGWLILWSRLFNLCDAARITIERRTLLSLHLANRALFELRLHLITVLKTNDGNTNELAADSLERLRAYAALCLWEDAQHYRAFLEEDTLAAIYSPEITRRFIQSLGDNRARWEAFAGPIEELSDQEAEFDRERARQQCESRLAWLLDCLRDPRVERWVETIERRRKPVTFFSLLRETEGSVKKRLRSLGTEYGYLEYGKSSRIIHGISAEHLAVGDGPVFMPVFGDSLGDFDRLIDQVTWELRGVIISLGLLQSRVFGDTLSAERG